MSALGTPQAGKVTISDLAFRLGISKASVSYALNGQPGVSESTRARVLALASELGWYPSSSARALSHSRTDSVGIVLFRDPEQIGAEPFYMSILAGIEGILGTHEMNLLLRMVDPRTVPDERTRDLPVYERWAGEGRVDGVILFDHVHDDPRPPLLDRFKMPYVRLGAGLDALPSAGNSNVTVSQAADAATVVEALHRHGHRRIAFVSGPLDLLHEERKSEQITAHARRLGMSVVLCPADYSADDGGTATIAVMAGLVPGSPEFPTAVVYGNDLMAVGGLQALKRLNLCVPAQVSVISWDDSILCRLSSPSLSALSRSVSDLGRSSAQLLVELIGGHEPRNIQACPGVFQLRESLGRNLF
ncbi:LacI family DNA-binding transcriptional regulator [Arthrobacter psychrochitiniphilus]|uniref:LacI family DNA-binding transcriptional regulator n=1 Tax=Arthrobacter psychrochitiniphilus TaxID=291045 RepID=UPI003F7CA15E